MGRITERKRAEEELHLANAQLQAEQESLKNANITLKEVLERIESEKKENLLRVQSHVDRIVLPMVRKLERSANKTQSGYISLLRDNLAEITSPFVTRLEARYASLSPRETQICMMIKDGLSSKDIAAALHTSEGTVRNQRKTIRKKLGISHQESNLASFLRAM